MNGEDRPDGTLETYDYQYGTYYPSNSAENAFFEVDDEGYDWRELITHGTTNSPDGIANKTTREVKVLDEYSQNVLSETYVYTGSGYERISWVVKEFNDYCRGSASSGG